MSSCEPECSEPATVPARDQQIFYGTSPTVCGHSRLRRGGISLPLVAKCLRYLLGLARRAGLLHSGLRVIHTSGHIQNAPVRLFLELHGIIAVYHWGGDLGFAEPQAMEHRNSSMPGVFCCCWMPVGTSVL